MFDEAELTRVLRLHEKAFRLFTWLNADLKSGRQPLGRVAAALAFSDAARDWIRRHRENLPDDLRPAPEDLEAFSHLFVSYLSTSYEVVERSLVRCFGCWCCSYWNERCHLQVRNPDKKAKAVARQLKLLYLRGLAPAGEVEPLLGRQDLAGPLALATYAAELVRRSKFASQGEGVLALWREVAWSPGARKGKRVVLDAATILQAERTLADALRAR